MPIPTRIGAVTAVAMVARMRRTALFLFVMIAGLVFLVARQNERDDGPVVLEASSAP